MIAQPLMSRRGFLLPLLLLLGLVAALHLPGTASAGIKACRADPIVTLSNGRVVQMTTEIAGDPANVRMITYTLHAPAGTSVTNIAYTGGALAGKETVVFYADLPAGQYTTSTLVTVSGSRLSVKTTTRVGGQSATISGRSGQSLLLKFTTAA